MRISAKADYAVRAALELASSPDGKPIKGTKLAEAQEIPLQFLEHILLDLKRAGLIRTKRGARGGYWLAEDPAEVSGRRRHPRGRGPAGEHPGPAARGDDTTSAPPSCCATSGSRSARTSARSSRTSRSRSSSAGSCRPRSHRCSTSRRPGRSVRPAPTTWWADGRFRYHRQPDFGPIRSRRWNSRLAARFGSFGPGLTPPHHGPSDRRIRIWHRPAGRHDRHGRRLADDAAADPDLRDPAGHRDRHRHLLRGGDEDVRRHPAPARRHRPQGPRLLDGLRQRSRRDRRRRRDRLSPADRRRGQARRDRLRHPRRDAARRRVCRRRCGRSSSPTSSRSATRSTSTAATSSPRSPPASSPDSSSA